MSAISTSEYEARIKALEKLNATLAAEIDRIRPVVEAAQAACRPSLIHASLLQLNKAVRTYEANRESVDAQS